MIIAVSRRRLRRRSRRRCRQLCACAYVRFAHVLTPRSMASHGLPWEWLGQSHTFKACFIQTVTPRIELSLFFARIQQSECVSPAIACDIAVSTCFRIEVILAG